MDEKKSIEEMMEGQDNNKRDRKSWVGFVESDVVNFVQLNGIEKMTMDDGEGNKAKITRRKDGSFYVECTSASVL